MASQTEKDTAKAAAKTQADTAKAQAKTSSTNAQTQADTARARSRQNGGEGGTSERMSRREAAAGLSNTTSGRGVSGVSSSRAEDASGATVLEDGSIARSASGSIDPFYVFEREIPSEEVVDHGVHDNTNDTLPAPVSSFSAIICRNGIPFSASIQGIVGNEIID